MNFHARYVLCDSIIPQKTFYIGISNYLLDLPLGKTRVFTFDRSCNLSSNRTSCPSVLICKEL